VGGRVLLSACRAVAEVPRPGIERAEDGLRAVSEGHGKRRFASGGRRGGDAREERNAYQQTTRTRALDLVEFSAIPGTADGFVKTAGPLGSVDIELCDLHHVGGGEIQIQLAGGG